MRLLDLHQSYRQQIFDYFGYNEDWRVLPLEDSRDFYWYLPNGEEDCVRYARTVSDLKDEAKGEFYESEIYKQRHLPRWVYRGEEYTMIVTDTHCDGNQFLQVFTNSMEVSP